jgi:hypothetical protein
VLNGSEHSTDLDAERQYTQLVEGWSNWKSR